jgi:hypothetical protein
VEIRLEANDLPGRLCGPSPDAPAGYANVHVGVQLRGRGRAADLAGLVPGDAATATWSLPCEVVQDSAGVDLRGPSLHGRPYDRFIYLTWGTIGAVDGNFTMFRRAKLMLAAVAPEVLAQAGVTGRLVGRLGLTDTKGQPLCAAVRPPRIRWSA